MRTVNNWAIAAVFAGAFAFAAPSFAQVGGQAGGAGQAGGTGQTGQTSGQGQSGTSGGGAGTGMGTGSDAGSGMGTASQTGAQSQSDLQKFVEQAAIGNMAEIQLSQLAQQNAQDPQVKQFAQTMIDQHTKAQDELKQIASKAGLSLPLSLDSKHQKIQDKLSNLHGADFDRKYIKAMVADHKDAQRLLQKRANAPASASSESTQRSGATGTTGTEGTKSGVAGTSGEVSSIDSYAATTLPTVQQHLQMAKDLEKQVKDEGRNDKSGKNDKSDKSK